MKNRKISFLILILLAAFVSSCASTGPKVTKAERKQKEEEFNRKFLEASSTWLPRVYRVGYQLLTAPVPDHAAARPKFNFIGVGVEELKDYVRKVYKIEPSVKGVLVIGTYPGSKAEKPDLQPGDVITKLNGKKTKNLGAYFKRVRKAEGNTAEARIRRQGKWIERELPLEKVYYNAQFFLGATPDFDANSTFSKIRVGIGAIRYCRNDDELAVIMGHELAHTTLKHSLKAMGGGISTGAAGAATAAVIDAFTFPGVGSLIVMPVQRAVDAAISRRYEREADYYGMKHAFHGGYDVQHGARVFSRLATDSPNFALLAYTFASHPKTSERFLRLEKIMEEFKTKYPDRFPLEPSPDWEVVIPVEAGETLEEAVDSLLKENAKKQGGSASSSPHTAEPKAKVAA